MKELIRQMLQDIFWNKQDSDTVAELVKGYLQPLVDLGQIEDSYCKYHNGRLTVFSSLSDLELHRFQVIVQIKED